MKEMEYPKYLLTQIPEIPTLRDFFAGCALMGLYAENSETETYPMVAACAYAQADAMLKARGEK
jgi:hypothetical protein